MAPPAPPSSRHTRVEQFLLFETDPSNRALMFKPIPFVDPTKPSPPPPLKLVGSADDRKDLLRRRAGLPVNQIRGGRTDRLGKAKYRPALNIVNFTKLRTL